MPELVVPRVNAVPSFVAFALRADDDNHPLYGPEAALRAQADPAGYVEELLADTRERSPRRDGWVPATHLWWVDGDEFLGHLHVWHRLNDQQREIGGQVGYYVVPAHRGKGHATAMLAAALPVAFALGMDCVLVTCSVDNVGSRKAIERNGGLFQDERQGYRRYWVPTS